MPRGKGAGKRKGQHKDQDKKKKARSSQHGTNMLCMSFVATVAVVMNV
jgi:hypothetical protein